jgi:hypothetical protein
MGLVRRSTDTIRPEQEPRIGGANGEPPTAMVGVAGREANSTASGHWNGETDADSSRPRAFSM